MRLTVLGINGPFPGVGGACSGYLLKDKNTQILLDCGSGVLANLQKFTNFKDLDAIVLSHLHSDHIGDMLVLIYALQIKMRKGEMTRKIPVYTPNTPTDLYEKLAGAGVFECIPIENNDRVRINDLIVSFKEMVYPCKTMAISIFNGYKRFVYSGDTSYNEDLVDFSRNADLIMLDSGLLSNEKTENSVHMTAEECGRVAKLSGSRRLLLTHFWPENDSGLYVKEARTEYAEADAAVLLGQYDI